MKGISQYIAEVKSGAFPDDDHSYGVDEKEYEKFLSLVEKRKAPLKRSASSLTELEAYARTWRR